MGKIFWRLTAGVAVCSVSLSALSTLAAPQPSYVQALDKSLIAMETGRQIQALEPLKNALYQDRNEPMGIITLGTLYLQTGSVARAQAEFERAHRLAPQEPLATYGLALSLLAQKKPAEAIPLLNTLSDDTITDVSLVQAYARLMQGEAAAVRAETQSVTVNEPNPFLLEIAAFAALRGGDAPRGEELMNALVNRPEMRRLVEDRTYLLPFETDLPVEGGVPPLPSAIGFPTAVNGAPLSGRVTLSPGNKIPDNTALVTYVIEGGALSASTNYPPFTSDWNTSRLPNGLYTLRVTLYDSARRPIQDVSRTVVLSNPNAPRSTRLTATESYDIQTRLKVLLAPRPCRKAAYFALANRAAARGDSDTALKHIESVVAIDPAFGDARGSLRRYNRAVLGPREGIWKAETAGEKLIALTFDDGPNPAPNRTPALLDALKTANATGTFFVVGLRAEQSPDLLRRMDAEGHEIGNHSFSHPNLTNISTLSVDRELCRTSCIVRDAIGKRPKFFRPPGGNFNHDVVTSAESLGMSGAYWTVDAIKFESYPFTKDQLVKYVLKEARPGAIVLLHNAPDLTVAAVPEIVAGLRARGYTLVTMSDLVRRTAKNKTKKTLPVAKRPMGYGG